LGKISVSDFEQIILSKNRNKAGRAVPAEGLFLMEVNY
jgi:tRNA pseudouridine38-40 synthase